MALALDLSQQSLSALERVKACCPSRPFCSDDKTASLIRVLPAALKRKYIQINQPTQVYWLIFDLDHDNPYIWQDEFLPAPNLMVITPETGRSHLFYAIAPVCTSQNARQKPIDFMNAVKEGFGLRLGADPDYSSPVAKNPFHSSWRTAELHNHVYELSKLAEFIRPSRGAAKGPHEIPLTNPLGRNCTLFDNVRRWAYERVAFARSSGHYEKWHARVFTFAQSQNTQLNPRNPLPDSEIKATAKSIAKWTWTRYTGDRRRRGVMKLDSNTLSLSKRQRMGASWTHRVRVEKTVAKLAAAIIGLSKRKQRITATAVAQAAGISRQTISARYRHMLEPEFVAQLTAPQRKPIKSTPASPHSNVVPIYRASTDPVAPPNCEKEAGGP